MHLCLFYINDYSFLYVKKVGGPVTCNSLRGTRFIKICESRTYNINITFFKSLIFNCLINLIFLYNELEWADIGYNFLVGGDGRIYEGRGWKRVGAHTQNYNSKSIAISFMGNFDKELPNTAMLTAAKNLIDCGVQKV